MWYKNKTSCTGISREEAKELYERDRIFYDGKVTYTSEFLEMRFRTTNMWSDKAERKAIAALILSIVAVALGLVSLIWQ